MLAAGSLIVTNFASAPFPHPQRANGHRYRNQVFPAPLHYSDSRVALFVPGGFRAGKQVDFVVHIHGWRAALEELLEKFKLVDQFRASGRNAVLVVPQGPLRAPDSFGGKLEDRDGLRRLLTEALAVLREHGDYRPGGHWPRHPLRPQRRVPRHRRYARSRRLARLDQGSLSLRRSLWGDRQTTSRG